MELLPQSGDELHGISVRSSTTTVPGTNKKTVRIESGPAELIDVREDYWLSKPTNSNEESVASVIKEEDQGRSTLTINFTAVGSGLGEELEEYGVQELRGFDIVKDISLSPYFKTLNNEQVKDVKDTWNRMEDLNESWNDLQKTLYRHYAHGVVSFVEGAYEFLRIFQLSGQSLRKFKIDDHNNVITTSELTAKLSSTMRGMTENFPDGEWLKSPVEIVATGRTGYTVTERYRWQEKWSIMYPGGTGDFTA